jgi:hypothetical protein
MSSNTEAVWLPRNRRVGLFRTQATPVAFRRPFPIAGTMGSTPTDFTSPTEYDARSLPPFASQSEDRSVPDGASIEVRIPSSRHQPAVSTQCARFPHPTLRSVLGVPPAHNGLLHHRPCGFVSPHSRVQGFPFRGFPLTEQSWVSPANALMPLNRTRPGLTRSSHDPRLQGLTHRESPLTTASRKAYEGPVPLLGFLSPRVLPRHTVRTLSRPFRP